MKEQKKNKQGFLKYKRFFANLFPKKALLGSTKPVFSFLNTRFFLANLPKEDGAQKLPKQLLCLQKKKNCGQAQNLETIIVILIVTIIIALAIGLFYSFQSKSLENIKLRYQENLAINLLSTLPLTPELAYTELGYDKASIDAAKLLTSQPKLKSNLKIELIQVYPEKPKVLCSQSTYPECSTYVIYNQQPKTANNQEILSIPVSLYHPIQKQKGFAILSITLYY